MLLPCVLCHASPMGFREPRSVSEFRESARTYIDQYTDPARRYAFATYDLAPTHHGPLQPSDIFMANLLSLRLGWDAVTPLFVEGADPYTDFRVRLDTALEEARQLPALEDCSDSQLDMPALGRANAAAKALRPVVGRKRIWTPVTVSKVLHRLARNVPLIDSRVRSFYRTQSPEGVRRRMSSDLRLNQGWLSEVAEKYPIRSAPMPLSRVADILIWIGGTIPRPSLGVSDVR
ncbi:DUF6308 family protein [Natronosporangium hydrolyticum]|uniref:DUF6308 family protein n=1 Tax=Natronosporangium hydrolyticum TaxID=2811111 RepID=UPI003B8496F4